MTIELWVDLFLMIALVILVAYIVSSIDIWLIHRRARKHNEQQQLLHRLKRRYD